MYTTMPKYSRAASQTLYATSQQVFAGAITSGGMPSVESQYNGHGGGLYMSGGTMSQRPLSASALPETAAGCRNYWSQSQGHSAGHNSFYRHYNYNKRKSAVELLAESKPFYIKSDAVFERLQQSGYRTASTTGGNGGGAGVKRGRRPEEGHYSGTSPYDELEDRRYMSLTRQQQAQVQQQYMHSHHQHHHHRHNPGQTQSHGLPRERSGSAVNNNLLQHKLRMLLGSEANKDRSSGGTLRRHEDNSDLLPAEYGEEESSALRIPPPLYLPAHAFGRDSSYAAYPSEPTSGGEEPLVLTENYRPISPPAEYAAKSSQAHNDRYRYNYQRSYSHSHEVANPDERAPYTAGEFNINSHKSLPDLHTQISRHSPHSEILSCCSRGNRSIKSAGESSINRDSGGSSGHYTHRSEPCYKRQRETNPGTASGTIKNCCNLVAATRRDSGSSTQHSANSYCGYVTPAGGDYPPLHGRNTDCIDCRCKQDTGGGPVTGSTTMSGYDNAAADYLLNFTPTPEVPEAFQDDYTPTPPSPRLKTQTTPRYSSSSSQQLHTSSQGYTSINHSQSSLVQSPGSAPSVDDISPPPIQFKRQRCIRFKNRNRLPVQPRTSPINNTVECLSGGGGGSAGYKRNMEHENVFFPKGFSADGYAMSQSHGLDMEREALNASISELEKFFDRLGLNDEAFHEIYSHPRRRHNPETDSDDSSTVFFSDVSTVDSMRLPDSTETQPQTTQPYRPSEPPSIVERNARIIKWLCNCKKMQCT